MRRVIIYGGCLALFFGAFLCDACDAAIHAAPQLLPAGYATERAESPLSGPGEDLSPACNATDRGDNAPSGSGHELSPAGQAIRFYQKYISDLRRGRCRFEPSCSEYAREAINGRGLILGTALAADRLMRCNARASRWYERNERGNLVDSPAGRPAGQEKPLIPAWLLFSIESPPIPDSLREYADFADALEDQSDCWRAATEYKRIAFVGKSCSLEFWTSMRIGACYFRNEEWEDAAAEFTSAAAVAPGPAARNAAWYVTAASRLNQGSYKTCRRVLLEAPFDWIRGAGAVGAAEAVEGAEGANRGEGSLDSLSAYSSVTRETWLVLCGLCAMGMGDWDVAGARFDEAAEGSVDRGNGRRFAVLAERARAGPSVHERSPAFAAVISAILPGSGQVYCGRYYDGFRHFMFNGLLISTVYSLAKDERYAGTYLVAGLALPFYLGNVMGAKKSAEAANAAARIQYLRDSIELTDE